MEFISGSIRHAAISKWQAMGIPRLVVSQRTLHRSEGIVSQYYDKSPTPDLSTVVTENVPNNVQKSPSRSWIGDATHSIIGWMTPFRS